ncbi:hypothetical protein HAX54_023233 [Datura stramonium]|uniref:Uncharacterized protein n=1 Tax=Datura stramonium TaxID=4076 RepID=A0ABS8UW11_DATST|nr:hypothetical protein [Datura stramonium]
MKPMLRWKQVLRKKPNAGWIKINTDESLRLKLKKLVYEKHRRRRPLQLPSIKPSVWQMEAQLVSLTHAPLKLWLCDTQVLASALLIGPISVNSCGQWDNSARQACAHELDGCKAKFVDKWALRMLEEMGRMT